MPLSTMISSSLAGAVLAAAWFGGGDRLESRALLEFGRISVPKRLQDRGPDGSPERVIFSFDRIVNSIFLMGSHTPIAERLVVAAVAPDLDAEGRMRVERKIRSVAVERTEDVRWERKGDVEVGRGIHSVNTHETPAIVLMRDIPEHGLVLGYMVWEKDCRLDEARRRLREIEESFVPGLSSPEFFEIERGRPAALAASRRAALAEFLAARGVELTVNAPPVVHEGVIYHLSENDPEKRFSNVRGQWFFVMHPLGTLPADPRGFYHLRPIPPKRIGRWPDVMFLRWEEDVWISDGIDRNFGLHDELQSYLRARQGDAGQVSFYAVAGAAVDECDPRAWEVQSFHMALPEMDRLFREGKLVAPRDW